MGPLHRLNHAFIFSPDRWPHREALSRCVALIFIVAFLVLKLVLFDQFPQTKSEVEWFYGMFTTDAGPIYSSAAISLIWKIRVSAWLMEIGVLLGYMASYLSRVRARAIASGFMETAFPIFVAALPVLISFTPYNLPGWAPYDSPNHIYVYLSVMGLIIIGSLINLIGLLTMRRAFAIMTEARALVTNGIFSRIRHPIYCGHFLMFLGSLLLRLHSYTILMYLIFVVGQVIRAKLEERKLKAVFPEYESYCEKTGMFWPKLI